MKNFLITLLKSVLFFVVWALLATVLPIPDSAEPAVWRFWAELMPFVAVLFCTLAGWIGERRQLKIVGRITGGALATGAVVGLFWIGLVISILVLGGFMTVGRERQTVPLLGLWLVALLLNTVMQELLVRGYLYRLIQRHYNTVAAALVTTLLFYSVTAAPLKPVGCPAPISCS